MPDEELKGMTVVGVFGPFASRALVEMSVVEAEEFCGGVASAAPLEVVSGALRDLEQIKARDERVGGSALAASAVTLAYELANPYNSATSKALCARALRETMDRLEEMLPPEVKERDGIDQLAIERDRRRRSGAA